MKWLLCTIAMVSVMVLTPSVSSGDPGTNCPAGYVQDRIEGCQEQGIWVRTTSSPKPKPKPKINWQYRWEVWLPANWVAVARCETGLNFRHSNSSYVSAFGIQRGAAGGQYDNDARRAGAPRWNDAHPPTPWQQYRTALMHYRLYGDGWGCPGP